ncbi:MAG: hypothetical protein ABEK36_03820 [Candidatus Aenigmatarchaeota archaeon]
MIATEALFGIVIGWIVALAFEKYYVSRATVLPNVVAIFFLMWPTWNQVNTYVQWFILVGILLGIIALILRIKQKKIPSWIYDLTYPFYSGKTLMPIYTSIVIFKNSFPTQLYQTPFWIVVIVMLVAGWYIGVRYIGNDYPFKKLFS